MTKPMETNDGNWEICGGSHGLWRTCAATKAFGKLSILIHSTSDRAAPTERQKEAFLVINDLPQSKHAEVLARIAEHFDEDVEQFESTFDLAEIPLIDKAASTYFYLECDAPDGEHRLTILFRNDEILGIVDRDAASEILEWDSTAEIEGLVWDDEVFDDDGD